MQKRHEITRFLIISLLVVCAVCIGIFSSLVVYMNRQNERTVNQVGSIYMESMNDRVSKHFSTMVDLRLTQLNTLVQSLPIENNEDGDTIREWLEYNAKIRGFDALAYYFDDGSFEMIYGTPAGSVDKNAFLEAMQKDERKISIGVNPQGDKSAVIGVPFEMKMPDGRTAIAMVGKMSLEYISETLSLDEEDALLYSFVIRKDGSYVVRSADVSRDNYFERARALYDEVEGKEVEEFLSELKQAITSKKDYSAMFKMNGERSQMYCSSLPSSEWYLITIMPYGALNEVVEMQGTQSLTVFVGSCIVILLVLFIIFLLYFRMSHAQVQELEEAKLMAEEASRSKSEFLSNMSHDIRTPMNAIVGMTAIAMTNIDKQDRVVDCLKKITLSSKHLLGLINDVLDMSKIESGKMILNVELVSLREIMDSIVSIVQPQIRAKQQKFNVFIYDITSENVLCDSVRFNQILLNLLSNAIKFTPEGGSIEVSLHEQSSPKGDEYVRILLRVKDDGIGMTEEFQRHIFDSFTREDNKRVQKTEGTGLGMAITKYIVDAMGGNIEVKSTQEVGTEFNVTLDFGRSAEQEKDMILPDFTMLVVDDDKQLCESTTASLKSIGIRAEWTLDGENAIRMVNQHHAIHNDYHIILLDWKLPGMDGIKTARELRKQLGNDVPILLISAYDCSEIEDEAREAGISGFLSKPLFKSTLYYGLKPYIDSSAASLSTEEAVIDFSGKRVLVAEDNELNWEIAGELLKERGLELDWAENGQICADMFSQSPVGYYDAVLMDIRMPVKDGYEASDMIRSMERPDASLPIIAMTADAFSEDIQKCLEHGMNAHVAKPIDIKEVSRILSKHFDSRK
ncbi:MAG: response regulator [Lachnospiraceae bacterium]|nr:response regulator [Lachnospiraceae bacterium]